MWKFGPFQPLPLAWPFPTYGELPLIPFGIPSNKIVWPSETQFIDLPMKWRQHMKSCAAFIAWFRKHKNLCQTPFPVKISKFDRSQRSHLISRWFPCVVVRWRHKNLNSAAKMSNNSVLLFEANILHISCTALFKHCDTGSNIVETGIYETVRLVVMVPYLTFGSHHLVSLNVRQNHNFHGELHVWNFDYPRKALLWLQTAFDKVFWTKLNLMKLPYPFSCAFILNAIA